MVCGFFRCQSLQSSYPGLGILCALGTLLSGGMRDVLLSAAVQRCALSHMLHIDLWGSWEGRGSEQVFCFQDMELAQRATEVSCNDVVILSHVYSFFVCCLPDHWHLEKIFSNSFGKALMLSKVYCLQGSPNNCCCFISHIKPGQALSDLRSLGCYFVALVMSLFHPSIIVVGSLLP